MKIKLYKEKDLILGKDFFDKKISYIYIFLIYVVIFFTIIFIVFSTYFNLELKIQGNGILETKNDVSIIYNFVNGKVILNNMKQGLNLKKEDVLYEISNENKVLERENIKRELDNTKELLNFINNNPHINNELISNYKLKLKEYELKINLISIKIKELKSLKNNSFVIFKKGGLSKYEYEKIKNDFESLVIQKKQLKNELQLFCTSKKIEIINNIQTLELKLKQIENNISKLKVLSPISGNLEVLVSFNVNDDLPSDIVVAKIIPNDENYKTKIFINENDINKIKINQQIKYHIVNDKNENIELKGKVISISNDPLLKNGNRFYTVIGDINNPLNNINILKNGLGIKASIIYGEQTIMNHILNLVKSR